jgi:hypothetical protein
MFHSPRHDNELTFLDPFMPVAEFHAKPSFHHQEHFVFMLVVVKDKLALELVQLHMLAV